MSQNDLELIIHAFVSSRLDYCNSLFSCLNKKELSRLQLVQNSAARILTRSNRRTHISPILKALHWLPVSSRINFKILVLTFRALHGQAPPYISDLIQPYTPARALRSVDQNLLMVPRTRFRTRGDRSFQAVAPRLWNDLCVRWSLLTPSKGNLRPIYLFRLLLNCLGAAMIVTELSWPFLI